MGLLLADESQWVEEGGGMGKWICFEGWWVHVLQRGANLFEGRCEEKGGRLGERMSWGSFI